MNSNKVISPSCQNLRLDSSTHSLVKNKAALFSLVDLRWTKRTSTHPVGCIGFSEKVISWLESYLLRRIFGNFKIKQQGNRWRLMLLIKPTPDLDFFIDKVGV